MTHYTAMLLAPDCSHTVRFDLTADSIESARQQARQRGRALFRERGFTFTVRVSV